MARCNCYHQHGLKYVCYGTKEMEECSCSGDTSKCNFYPEKRKQKVATEKRLIDANTLITKIRQNFFWLADEVVNHIESSPTVDAVEVVHGRWEDMYDGKYANPRYRCSVCKEKALYQDKRDILGNWKVVQALTDYCPNCGAKMDGGADND